MICSICEEVSQVPTGTRIPTAFINTLWDRRLESGRQREICRRGAAQPPPKRMVTVEESTCLVSSGLFAASWNNSFECTGRSHSDEGLRCVFCSAAVWKTATLRSAAAWRRFMV
jgi:hypothetical protein